MQKKHELTEKIQKNQSFYNQMLNADANYKTMKIHAHYQNLSSINENLISKFQIDKKLSNDIYFVYGLYIDEDRVKMQLITQYFITVFPKPKNSYIFVYFNDYDVDNNFSNFKNMLGLMPVEYFINLEAIYLVRPSLKMKASRYFTFGTIPKYVNNKIVNIDNLEQLSKKLGVQKQEILKFLPTQVRNYFVQQQPKSPYLVPSSLPLTKSSGPTTGHHSKIQSTPDNSPKNNKNPNSSILSSPNQSKIGPKIPIKLEIDQYDKFQTGIPEVFWILLHYFKQHNHQLEQEGIFRKSVNIEQQTQALQKIHKKQYDFIEQIKDPHLVANLIKRFLSKLKTPIIQYPIFQTIMQCQNLSPQFLAQQLKQLSNINRTKYLTLMTLLDFLIRKVIPRSHKNKMPTQNVAICFAPCLMWAEQRSIKDLIYMNKSVAVLVLIINNFQTIFGNQKQIHKFIRTSYYQQKQKNILQTYNVEQLKPVHSIQQQRKTPNFGQLILQKHMNEQKAQQQDQYHIPQQKPRNTININVLSPQKLSSKSHVQTKQLKQDQKLLQNYMEQMERKSQRSLKLIDQKMNNNINNNNNNTNNTAMNINIVRTKPIFKSEIKSPTSPPPQQNINNQRKSNNSSQINSVHSGSIKNQQHK